MSFKSWAEEKMEEEARSKMYVDDYSKKLTEAFGKAESNDTVQAAKTVLSSKELDEMVQQIKAEPRRVTLHDTLYGSHTHSQPAVHTIHSNGSISGGVTSAQGTWQTGSVQTTQFSYDQSCLQFANDELIIKGGDGSPMVAISLVNGEVKFLGAFHIDAAARIFWTTIGKSTIGLVSARELEKARIEANHLANELSKTKELLSKVLKELAKKYEAEESEDVESI